MSYLTDFQGRTDLITSYGNNALLLYALELRFEISDIFSVAAEALTDGGEDKKCDLIYVDKDNGVAVIAQGYMRQNAQDGDLAPENKASDLNTAAAWVFSQNPETVPERIRDQVRELQNAIKDDLINIVYFWYVHNLNENNNPKVKTELTTMQTSANAAVNTLFPESRVEIFALEIGTNTMEKWFSASNNQIAITEDIVVETLDRGFELTGCKWRAYVTAVTAKWLKTQHDAHKDDIFSGNPRNYLGSGKKKNKINLGIIETIKNEPGNFWAYNNGVTALVNSYRLEQNLNSQKNDLVVSGMTIINGAQTTGAISSVDDIREAWVPIRFIVCEDATIIDEIISNNNKQNEILASDLRSNDKTQNRLRTEFDLYPKLYYSGGRRGNRRPSRSREVIDPYVAAQSILAFHGDCVTAYNSRIDLWSNDRLYMSIFSDQLSAEHIIFTYSLSRAIDKYKLDLMSKKDERKETEELQYTYLTKRGAKMLLIATVSKCMESIIGDKIRDIWSLKYIDNTDFDQTVCNWMEIIKVILPVAANELGGVLANGLKSKETSEKSVSTVASLLATVQTLIHTQLQDVVDKITCI